MKTIAEKLQLKPGTTVWSPDATRFALVGELPGGVGRVHSLAEADSAIVFVDDAASTRAILDANRPHLGGLRALWVVYPKANRSDINRDSLWPILAGYRMRPNGQIAIDDTWSALRFRPDAADEEPFTGGR